MSLEELRSQVLTLDYRDRAALVHDLLNSLETLPPDQLEAVWAEEADRRLEELRSGSAEETSGPEVLRQARALIRARRDTEVTARLNAFFADHELALQQARSASEWDAVGTDWSDERW